MWSNTECRKTSEQVCGAQVSGLVLAVKARESLARLPCSFPSASTDRQMTCLGLQLNYIPARPYLCVLVSIYAELVLS